MFNCLMASHSHQAASPGIVARSFLRHRSHHKNVQFESTSIGGIFKGIVMHVTFKLLYL